MKSSRAGTAGTTPVSSGLGCALFVALALAASVPASAAASDAMPSTQIDPHAACSIPPSYVPAQLLERPVRLRQGIGNSHQTVTTSYSEAQAFYDQGLNYLESYVWIEAARSFHQALRLDPSLALAYVGLSRVESGLDNPPGARRYFEKAQALAPGASPRERRVIDIREKQLAAMDSLDDQARFLAYKKAIDDALNADLDDPSLWLLRGNAEESNASGRGQRGTAGSVAFYEQALKLVPDCASAHHYLIHTCETIGRIDKALEHGERYARLAPAIPHAAHMWGHDLRRVGRVDEAIIQFLKADSLERAYYAEEKLDPSLDWHHGHNLDLLASCYQHKGQMKLAEERLKESASLSAMDASHALNRGQMPNFFIHRGRYKEALEAARGMTRTDYPQSRCAGHALAGQALIGLGRMAEAKEELEAARRELEMVRPVALGLIPRRMQVEPWVEGLRGEILLREGNRDEGGAVIREVIRAMRAIPGPDAWTLALFRIESMARTAREAGDWELATFIAGQMLEHDPEYGGSHRAQALVLRHQGDGAGAARESDAALARWRDADRDLRELKDLTPTRTAER
jgi:tetratricopeptide (TPR) repeat protein